jgi:very-short-patch-repair endonuclease
VRKKRKIVEGINKGENKMQRLLQKRSRQLRKNMTEAERKLWGRLRRRQLGGLRFRRQVPFDKYIADFVCFEPKIIIEVDGSQHLIQVAYDAERTKFLQLFGYKVLRFWNSEVLNDIESVLQTILDIPPSARWAPSPEEGRPPF